MLSKLQKACPRLTESTRTEIRPFLVLGVVTGLIWATFTLSAGVSSL